MGAPPFLRTNSAPHLPHCIEFRYDDATMIYREYCAAAAASYRLRGRLHGQGAPRSFCHASYKAQEEAAEVRRTRPAQAPMPLLRHDACAGACRIYALRTTRSLATRKGRNTARAPAMAPPCARKMPSAANTRRCRHRLLHACLPAASPQCRRVDMIMRDDMNAECAPAVSR